MIIPVIYNKETIAVLEIASESIPQTSVLNYIDNIHEQLAIGLVNAKSFEQLENLVNELRDLNEEYQKQNNQIVEQNSQLKELHLQLQEKAGELELQRAKAVELTKVKSEFLASMSHELRTPLISIIGFSQMLQDENLGGLNARQAEYINDIADSGRHLLSLINDILDFSKIEAKKLDLEVLDFDLQNMLDDFAVTHAMHAQAKGLEIFYETKWPKRSLKLDIGDELYDLGDQITGSKQDYDRAMALLNAGKFTEARRDYAALAKGMKQKIFDVYYGLGEVAVQTKDTPEAVKNIKTDFKILFIYSLN